MNKDRCAFCKSEKEYYGNRHVRTLPVRAKKGQVRLLITPERRPNGESRFERAFACGECLEEMMIRAVSEDK